MNQKFNQFLHSVQRLKIIINNDQELRQVQRILFEYGFTWVGGSQQVFECRFFPSYIFTKTTTHRLTHSESAETYETLSNAVPIPVQDVLNESVSFKIKANLKAKAFYEHINGIH